MEWLLAALAACALTTAAFVLLRRGPDRTASDRQALVLDKVARSLGQMQSELQTLARTQDELRADVQRTRESSIVQLSQATQALRGDISLAHRALAEVKALEAGRARQMQDAADSLRRLEAVVAGSSTRGVAGENILMRALAQLPPDLLAVNVAFGNKIVEYALRLPGGRFLPIDSKWTSVAPLEQLEEAEQPQDRKRLVDQIAREVRGRIRDMAKYLDPERTLQIGLLAVPDAVYGAAPEAHAEGYRAGVLVVPYSLALPYVLAVYRLTLRFGGAVDTDELAGHVRALEEALRRVDEEVEGRLSRGLGMVDNSREAVRGHLSDARRAAHRLMEAAEAEDAPEIAPSGRVLSLPVAVAED